MRPLARYTTLLLLLFHLSIHAQDGSLDTSFGNGGKVVTSIGLHDEGRAIAIQEDGKIVVVGSSAQGSYHDFVILRYQSNGSLDSTFGTNGVVLTAFGNSAEKAMSVVIQGDGKLVVAGHAHIGSEVMVAIARYNLDGSLDDTFGIQGKMLIRSGKFESYCTGIGVQNDGKIVLCGASRNEDYVYDFLTIRLLTNGMLDSTFSNDGIRLEDLSTELNDFAKAILIQPDQNIIVAGYMGQGMDKEMAMVKYLPDGELEHSFGKNGILQDKLNTIYQESIEAIIRQPDGKIIVVGNSSDQNYDEILIRYHSNGSLDSTFGKNGIVVTDHDKNRDWGYVNGLALQKDGTILTVGVRFIGTAGFFHIVKYTSNGDLDFTFGDKGTLLTSFDGSSQQGAFSIALQENGNFIVVGSSYNVKNRIALARYNAGNTVSAGKPIPVSDGLRVYPNPCPANGSLVIQHPASKENGTVEIRSWNGTTLASFATTAGATETSIKVPELIPGTYLVRILTAGKHVPGTLFTVH